MSGHRWWSAEDLRSTGEAVFPVRLGELLADLTAKGWDGHVRLLDE